VTIWRFLVILCFVVSLGLTLVWLHASQLQTGHEMAGALRTREALLKEHVQLEAELSALSTADRITSKVKEFDLHLVNTHRGSSVGERRRPARVLSELQHPVD